MLIPINILGSKRGADFLNWVERTPLKTLSKVRT